MFSLRASTQHAGHRPVRLSRRCPSRGRRGTLSPRNPVLQAGVVPNPARGLAAPGRWCTRVAAAGEPGCRREDRRLGSAGDLTRTSPSPACSCTEQWPFLLGSKQSPGKAVTVEPAAEKFTCVGIAQSEGRAAEHGACRASAAQRPLQRVPDAHAALWQPCTLQPRHPP